MMTAKEIAQAINGELRGDGAVRITGVNGIAEATEGDIAFLLDARFAAQAAKTKAGCVVVPRGTPPDPARTTIAVEQPSIAFSQIIDMVMPDRVPHPRGIHPTATVAKDAVIGKDVSLGAYVVVESGASIGDGTVVHPQCYIGHRTTIGAACIVYPNVTVREGIAIGNRVIIHPGTVIGGDGFGYDTKKDGTHVKIPQLGTVVIEDDVEIGSCVTVDRARFNRTVISRGTKIDNLVQVAHNVIIGPHCLIAAQTGISGSAELGRNVILAGQVGVADHVKLGDFCIAGAQAGVSKSFPARTTLLWFPAKPIAKARELIASVGLLPKLFGRVRALESRLKELEKK